MSLIQTQINSVKSYLLSQCMNVVEEWIAGCVEYLSENNSHTLEEIQNLAKEQWLLNDLKEICPGSLPPNLREKVKVTLNGRFTVQINAAIDIGTPAYQQYLKLQKVNLENIEETLRFEDKIPNHRDKSFGYHFLASSSDSEEIKLHIVYRMIKLYLTDGVQDIFAIEYRPMRNLSCDITPGCKVVLKGPIECRRGVLLLTEASVELLGGEAQEISVSNSLAGLVAAKLDLPMPREDPNSTINQPRNTNIPTPNAEMPPALPRTEPEPPNHPDPNQRPIAIVTSLQVAENQFNEEEIDYNQIDQLEAEFSSPIHNKRSLDSINSNPQKKSKLNTKNNENKRYSDSDITTNIGHSSTYNRTNEAQSTIYDSTSIGHSSNCVSTNSGYSSKIQNNKPQDYPEDENDIFCDEDEDYLRELEEKFNKPNDKELKTLSAEPFVYIKQINNMSLNMKAGRVFKVKAQILKLLSKLSVGKDGWSLKCTIIDGTGSIDVDFTSDVLSKLVGYTPNEMSKLKKEMTLKPELRERAVKALQSAKEALQVLYCIIELTILDTPKITGLFPFDDYHVKALDSRLNDL